MAKPLFTLSFFLLLFVPSLFAQGGPPPGYNWSQNPANGHSYALTLTQTWLQAAAEADALGPEVELVTVRDLSEHDWLWTNVALQTYAWIGYTDAAVEGQWVWRSGELTPWWASNGYLGVGGVPGNWLPSQPDNAGAEDFADMTDALLGGWNDVGGHFEVRPAILEWIGNTDSDIDDDGLLDADEISLYGTDSGMFDTDGDGLGDGQELGVTYATAPPDTNLAIFVEDADPLTTTDPLLYDTDGGGASDGNEDVNKNGAVDFNEGDPNDPQDDLFQLSILGLSPGQQATISVWECHPGSVVVPAFSTQGQGPIVFSEFQQLEVSLTLPITRLNGMIVGPGGTAFSFIWVPPFVQIGRTVYWQAVEITGGGDAYRPSVSVVAVVQ